MRRAPSSESSLSSRKHEACETTAPTSNLQVRLSTRSTAAKLRGDGQALRPVLPDRPRALDRRRALGAARRARAAEGAEALHRPRRPACRGSGRTSSPRACASSRPAASSTSASSRRPPPRPSTSSPQYGDGLEEVIHAIARWGARSLGPPRARGRPRPRVGPQRVPGAALSRARARADRDVRRSVVDDTAFTVRLDDGHLTVEHRRGGRRRRPRRPHGHRDVLRARLRRPRARPTRSRTAGSSSRPGTPPRSTRFFHVFSFAPRLGARPADDESRLGPRVRVEAVIPAA